MKETKAVEFTQKDLDSKLLLAAFGTPHGDIQ